MASFEEGRYSVAVAVRKELARRSASTLASPAIPRFYPARRVSPNATATAKTIRAAEAAQLSYPYLLPYTNVTKWPILLPSAGKRKFRQKAQNVTMQKAKVLTSRDFSACELALQSIIHCR